MMLQTKKMITNLSSNPWADIPTAISGQLSRRRVTIEADFALFWFRDEAGRPGLLIEISRLISHSLLKEARISIRDIAVDVIEVAEEGIRSLVIRLEDTQKQDVFLKLCLDLVEHVKASEQKQDTFRVVCRRLKKWQSLLSGKAQHLLSANEVQGLYAELYFLSEMLDKGSVSEGMLIRGWKGPDKNQHDFILGDIAVEIKSVTGDQRGAVRITSEDQLTTHLDRLYLRVYFLSEPETDARGESLNSIIRRVARQLTEQENRDLFETKLETARYIDIPDYDTPHFRVKDCRSYLVAEDFPRITRNNLPVGIENVTYDLLLPGIDKFHIGEIQVREDS